MKILSFVSMAILCASEIGAQTPQESKALTTENGEEAQIAPCKAPWMGLAQASRQALDRLGTRAFSPRTAGGLHDLLVRRRDESLQLAGLPDPKWMRDHVYGWTGGVLVTEARFHFPDRWLAWAQELRELLPDSRPIQAGVLWAAMYQASGPVDLELFRAFAPHYAFRGEYLGPCQHEWVRQWAREILAESCPSPTIEDWTVRSLAALAVADRYEQDPATRKLLSRALFQAQLHDPAAHHGALLGLNVYGGHHAAEALQGLVHSPGFRTWAPLVAFRSPLRRHAKSYPTVSDILVAAQSDRELDNFDLTRACLEAAGRTRMPDAEAGIPDESTAILNELIRRAYDSYDSCIDRELLLDRLLANPEHASSALSLLQALCLTDVEFTVFLDDGAALVGQLGSKPALRQRFVEGLRQIEARYPEQVEVIESVQAARNRVIREAREQFIPTDGVLTHKR